MEPHFHSQLHSVVNEPKVTHPSKHTNWNWYWNFFKNFIPAGFFYWISLKNLYQPWYWYWIFLVNFHTNLVVALGSKAFWLVSEGYIPDIEFGTPLK
jgi:hypothetical protein